MADPVAVAQMRARAESRLKRAVAEASKLYGVTFNEPHPQTKRQPALASAHFVEGVADFIEQINKQKKAS